MIHPQAIVDPGAILHDSVTVGPWTTIGANVQIGANTEIASHVVIKGPTTIGSDCRIFQFSTIGDETPDKKYQGEDTALVIGDHNVIREGVTIHRGTVQDRGETRIGDHNLIMAYSHIGHDSVIGNHVVMVNNASAAGHVVVGDWAVLGGYTLIYQRCQVGAHAFTGMGTQIGKDVPAFMMAYGAPAKVRAVNAEGLKRRGFSAEQVLDLRRAFKLLYRQGLTTDQALEQLAESAERSDVIAQLLDSVRASTVGIIR